MIVLGAFKYKGLQINLTSSIGNDTMFTRSIATATNGGNMYGNDYYYILTGLEVENTSLGYVILFGDYDKEVVKDEKIDQEYNNRVSGEYSNLEIHRVNNDNQITIDNHIKDLNADAHYNFVHNREII